MPQKTVRQILEVKTPQGKVANLDFKQGKNDEWYWTLTAKNSRQIGTCLPEMYKNREDCVNNAYDILFVKWSIQED